MTELRVVDGKPVPHVHRIFQATPPAKGEPWVWRPRWQVEFPDEFEWSCCRITDHRSFDTWPEALKYAMERRWEPL